MKKLLSVLVLACSSVSFAVHAQDAGCEAKASEKKLAGAAKASFMKKCEADAKGVAKTQAVTTAAANCDAQAAEKKLAGAAKTSFVKKCTADATK